MPLSNTLRLVEAAANDLDRIMELERQGFATDHRELRSAYAQRIATFSQGALMAWRGAECVGCVFSEIWRPRYAAWGWVHRCCGAAWPMWRRPTPHLTSVVLLVNAQWAAARHIYVGAGFVDVTHLEGFFGASGGTSQDGVVMHRPLPGA